MYQTNILSFLFGHPKGLAGLKDVKEVDARQIKSWEQTNQEEYPIEASFIDLPDLLIALDRREYKTENEELVLMQNICWASNDRVRAEKEIFAMPDHSAIWEDNLRKFQAILNPKDPFFSWSECFILLMIVQIIRKDKNKNKTIEQQ